MDKAVKAMSLLVDTILREAQEHIDRERKSVLDAKALAEAAAGDEIRRLKEQNAHLARLLQAERSKSEKAKDDLIKRISGLLGDFVSDRDRSLREAFADIEEGNEKAQGALKEFSTEEVAIADGVAARGKEWALGLEKKAGENKRLRDGSLKVRTLTCWPGLEAYVPSVPQRDQQQPPRRLCEHPDVDRCVAHVVLERRAQAQRHDDHHELRRQAHPASLLTSS
jgi:hypothetical protein